VCTAFAGFVVSLLFAEDLEILECGLFFVRQMSEMALRVSVFHHSGLDSMRGTGCRHDCWLKASRILTGREAERRRVCRWRKVLLL